MRDAASIDLKGPISPTGFFPQRSGLVSCGWFPFCHFERSEKSLSRGKDFSVALLLRNDRGERRQVSRSFEPVSFEMTGSPSRCCGAERVYLRVNSRFYAGWTCLFFTFFYGSSQPVSLFCHFERSEKSLSRGKDFSVALLLRNDRVAVTVVDAQRPLHISQS